LLIKSRRYQRLALAAQWNHTVAGNFSGPIYGAYAHLVTAFTGTPNDSTAWADVTEATYDGYAPQALVLPTATLDTVSGSEGMCDLQTWTPTGSVTPNVIVGIVYTDNAVGGNVLGIDLLPSPAGLEGVDTGFGSVTLIDLPWSTNGRPAVIVS
jgi:hypothetical protein